MAYNETPTERTAMFNRKPKTPLTPQEEAAKWERQRARDKRITQACNRILLGMGAGFLIYEGARRGAIQGAADFTKAFTEKLEEFVENEKNEAPKE